MVHSRNKGKAGELELAHELSRLLGVSARRGQQFSGSPDSPDVVGVPGLHIECKRVERLNIYGAMDQARRDSGETEVPVVMHRKNRGIWLVTFPLDDIRRFAEAVNRDSDGESG